MIQETELLRFRLLNESLEETEAMIAQYSDYLPLKRVVIPTMAELKEKERNGEVVSEEDKLLSTEMERVFFKSEKYSGKDEKEPDCSSPESEHGSSKLTAQQHKREFYPVCRGYADFCCCMATPSSHGYHPF